MDTKRLFLPKSASHPNAQCYFYFTNLAGQFEDFRATSGFLKVYLKFLGHVKRVKQ